MRTATVIRGMLVDHVDALELVQVPADEALRISMASDGGYDLTSLVVAVRIWTAGRDLDFATPKALTATAPIVQIAAKELAGVATLALVVTTAAASDARARFEVVRDPMRME